MCTLPVLLTSSAARVDLPDEVDPTIMMPPGLPSFVDRGVAPDFDSSGGHARTHSLSDRVRENAERSRLQATATPAALAAARARAPRTTAGSLMAVDVVVVGVDVVRRRRRRRRRPSSPSSSPSPHPPPLLDQAV